MFLSQTGYRRIALVAGAAVLIGFGFVGGWATAGQPHMQNALRALENAQSQLQVAAPDKAGHRVEAIRLINEAIGQVQAGIAAGAV